MADIIFLHGASSSGKSSIAKSLQKLMATPYLHFSSDQLVEAKVLPKVDRSEPDSAFAWRKMRPKFFDGFHRCVKGLADAGNDLIVDHIIEHPSWLTECVALLATHRVFYVGVHCDLEVLERREHARGDRQIGEARSHLIEDAIHSFSKYDFEVDTSHSDPDACASKIKTAHANFASRGVFQKLRT